MHLKQAVCAIFFLTGAVLLISSWSSLQSELLNCPSSLYLLHLESGGFIFHWLKIIYPVRGDTSWKYSKLKQFSIQILLIQRRSDPLHFLNQIVADMWMWTLAWHVLLFYKPKGGGLDNILHRKIHNTLACSFLHGIRGRQSQIGLRGISYKTVGRK